MTDHPESPSPVPRSETEPVETVETEQEEEQRAEGPIEEAPAGPPPPPPGGRRTGGEPPEGDGEDLGAKMTFLEHLDELRKRILYSAIAVIVAFGFCWAFSGQIFSFVAAPIDDVVGGIDKLVFLKPTEAFSIWLNVSFVAAIFVAIPVILFQVWLFIAPGLYRNEKVYAIPFLLSSTALFLLGGIFAYYIILPTALDFLINQFGAPFTAMITVIEYFNFALVILLGMGVIFQMPVLVAFLSIFGLITPGFLWRNFKYAFLLMVTVAAIVSPTTDIINLFLWSGPMVLLYLISIGISWIFARRRQARWE